MTGCSVIGQERACPLHFTLISLRLQTPVLENPPPTPPPPVWLQLSHSHLSARRHRHTRLICGPDEVKASPRLKSAPCVRACVRALACARADKKKDQVLHFDVCFLHFKDKKSRGNLAQPRRDVTQIELLLFYFYIIDRLGFLSLYFLVQRQQNLPIRKRKRQQRGVGTFGVVPSLQHGNDFA